MAFSDFFRKQRFVLPRLLVFLAAFLIMAGCMPPAPAAPMPAQTSTLRPASTPLSTSTSGSLDGGSGDMAELIQAIDQIISSKKATFGIGIYDFDDQAALLFNGDEPFALMSVVKFPQALALLDQVDQGLLPVDTQIHFGESDLRPDTYSPLRDERAESDFNLSLSEALSYAVSLSDNNVCDRLFKVLGGPEVAQEYLHHLGLTGITIGTDYADMAVNTIYANQSTPNDMLELLRMFYENELLSAGSTELLWSKLVETSTGPDRIKGLLPAGTVVGHKTGTGMDEAGITAAFNDVGIVELPDGGSFAIVVFIADSKEDSETNAGTIAEIAKAAYDYLSK